MKCNICGKEFGKGDNSQNCGADKVSALGEFSGYSTPNNKPTTVKDNISSPSSQHLEPVISQICWKCGEIIPLGKFCPACGQKLFRICPNCKTEYSSQYHICPNCGTNHIEYEKATQEDRNKKQEQLLRQEKRQATSDAIRRREIEHEKIHIRISSANRVLCFFVAAVFFIATSIAIGLLCSLVLFPSPPPSPSGAAAPGPSFSPLFAFILSGMLTFFLSKRFNKIWKEKKIANMEQFLFWRRFTRTEQRITAVDSKNATISFEEKNGKGMAKYVPEVASLRVAESSYFIIKSKTRQIKELQFVFDDYGCHSLQCEPGSYDNWRWTGLASEIKFKTMSSVDIASITITYAE